MTSFRASGSEMASFEAKTKGHVQDSERDSVETTHELVARPVDVADVVSLLPLERPLRNVEQVAVGQLDPGMLGS